MVRINLIKPICLSDQHLIAEYNEILMLAGYVKKYPSLENIPERYQLGKGHIKFFKNKLLYLKKRHELIRKEMNQRNFKTNKKLSLSNFTKEHKGNWQPNTKDFSIIKKRIINKINDKPEFYRYHSQKRGSDFFIRMIQKSSKLSK